MSEPSQDDIAKAWRNASDFDLSSALASPDDYPGHVNEIIRAEARRRGIEAGDVEPLDPLPADRAAKLIGDTARRVGPRLLRNPLLHAAALGVTVVFLTGLIPPFATPRAALAAGIPLTLVLGGCLAWVCRPLRSYQLVFKACCVFALVQEACGLFVSHLYHTVQLRAIVAQWDLYIVSACAAWAVLCLPLWSVVFLRNRYWPVYPEGHCQMCGYDLQGLPVRRCPECGEAF